jgi:hypothetical protein
LRIDREERVALENLSKIEGRPINQILNDAIKLYLSRQSQKEISLEATLAGLKAYRKKDPELRHAVDAFVEAEAKYDDPLEGEPVGEQTVQEEPQPIGNSQRKLRELLGG